MAFVMLFNYAQNLKCSTKQKEGKKITNRKHQEEQTEQMFYSTYTSSPKLGWFSY